MAAVMINGIISRYLIIARIRAEVRISLNLGNISQYNVLTLRSMGSQAGIMIETEIDFVQD